ncbi:MAG: Tetratricopeptide 2 repeat protein [Myxococcales bacterium]|nr:Tetratricopeptide 2 repeat protein [Myxococcales bacterium]
MQRVDLPSRALLSVAFLVVCAGRAHAQSAEAEALFSEGDKLMAEGKIAQACDSFDASNKIEARAGTLVRLGECREQNHQIASAWSAYKDALSRAKDPRKHDIALAKATELEPKLSYLTVSIPDEARVDGLVITRNGKPLDPVLWNRAVPVDGGEYVIGGRAPGHEEWNTKVTVLEINGKTSVDVPKFKEIAKLLEPTPTKPVAGSGDVAVDAPVSMFTRNRKIAIGVAGVSAVGVIAGIVLGTSAKGKQSDAHALCPDPQTPCASADAANELSKSGHSLALEANIAFGVAAAAAIGAGVLWFTGAPESPHRVAIVPSTNGVTIFGRF